MPDAGDGAGLPGVGRLGRLLASQVEALVGLPETVVALNRGVRGLAEAAAGARRSMLALERLAVRIEALLDELEPPLRRLAPHLEHAADVLADPDTEAVVRSLRETQALVARIAASTDRLSGVVEDAGGRLAALPGAALFSRGLRGEWAGATRPAVAGRRPPDVGAAPPEDGPTGMGDAPDA